jgi:hypothetical protein
VKFLTLRMRSPSLVKYINSLTSKDFQTITLDRPGKHNQPKVHESTVTLTSYPGTLRQLIVTGLGHDAPTVIITNHYDIKTKAIVERYARRMTIQQRLAEIIRAFCTDALSSTVNLNVDLDVMLAVLSQALLATLRARLPGYPATTPPPPTPCSAASWKPQARSSTKATPSPSAWSDAPTHPCCAKPASPPRPPSLVGQPHPTLRVRLNLAPNQLRGNPR